MGLFGGIGTRESLLGVSQILGPTPRPTPRPPTGFTSTLGLPLTTLGRGFVLGAPPSEAFIVGELELDPFSADPGTDAGRIMPATPGIRLDGQFVMCLGHDAPGLFEFFTPGDYAEAQQIADPAGALLMTFEPRTRPPVVAPPAGYSWKASILIDGVEISSRTIATSPCRTDSEDWVSWEANLSKLAGGAHELAFRLTLIGPPLPGPPGLPMLELEVPAFYLEKLAFSSPSSPRLFNLQPEDGQNVTAGPAPGDNTSIDFDIVDFGALGINSATLNVTVNGTPAVLAGVAQAGFAVVLTTPSADTLHVHITPSAPFSSSALVTVIASASTNAPATSVSRTWTFRVADTVPPALLSVQALETIRIRASFSEAVVAVSPTGTHDALNPANYALVPNITIGGVVPAVTPIVASVTPISAQQYDLITDIDLTPGVEYTLTATNVEDLACNTAPSSVEFLAFTPPAPGRRMLDLYRFLPLVNRVEDVTQDLLRFIRCLQEPTDLLLFDIDRWSNIIDVDLAPEPFVDAMLLDLGNPFPFILSLTDKRRLAHLLVAIYQLKGTEPGIINVVRFFLGLDVTITTFTGTGMRLGISRLGFDWILNPGTEFAIYSFRIISAIALTPDQRAKIRIIANYMKPAHTHLIDLVEPTTPTPYDPLVLGVSRLGFDWILHGP